MKAIVLLLVLATSLVATSATACEKHNQPNTQNQSKAFKVSLDTAKANAIKAVGGGVATKIDLDTERGQSYYDIKVNYNNQEYDVKIDPNTGAVISKKLDD